MGNNESIEKAGEASEVGEASGSIIRLQCCELVRQRNYMLLNSEPFTAIGYQYSINQED